MINNNTVGRRCSYGLVRWEISHQTTRADWLDAKRKLKKLKKKKRIIEKIKKNKLTKILKKKLKKIKKKMRKINNDFGA